MSCKVCKTRINPLMISMYKCKCHNVYCHIHVISGGFYTPVCFLPVVLIDYCRTLIVKLVNIHYGLFIL